MRALLEIQAVRGRVQTRPCEDHGPSDLVFIGHQPDRRQVAARLSELTRTAWK